MLQWKAERSDSQAISVPYRRPRPGRGARAQGLRPGMRRDARAAWRRVEPRAAPRRL